MTKSKPSTEYKISCPGCGNLAPVQRSVKGEHVFQFLDCQKCGLSWGTIQGTGRWHVLGAIDDKGLLISRRPHGVKV